MKQHIPNGTRIGIFDAGILKYYSDVSVVNLDGLMSVPGNKAIKEKNMYAFLKEWHVAYILAPESYIEKNYQYAFGPEKARSYMIPLEILTASPDPLTLYAVK